MPLNMEQERKQKRITELIKALPVDRKKLEDLLLNNSLEDIEVKIYGSKIGKVEKAIKKAIRHIGIKPKIKNSEDRRHVIVKLNKHMKFIILDIEA
ncbi:hypothetical protein NEMIN01_0789 [Nematocida minor]|uniref:uncharacterized protein n=1 Tax=Nematocida minor TaxID=1912983 RepID=UPI00221FE3D4|nr:uncharacterized protein NEMIN01_0789 [Nematocida minor]KAI5190004.1 hypothetical protein NEMIN01_0789 [Nematocida minor]